MGSGCTPPVKKPTAGMTEITSDSIATASITEKEYVALCNSLLGIAPEGLIIEIQSILRALNVQPTESSISTSILVIPAILIAFITFTLGMIWKFSKKYWMFTIPLVIILCVAFYFVFVKPYESFISLPRKPVENFQVAAPPTVGDQYNLINIQPAAVKQIGYVGPSEVNGSFDMATNIIATMNAGVRAFTMQIDYLETNKGAGFDKKGDPTLLYRDNQGTLISTNGESIREVAKNLKMYAFNSQFPTASHPIILYLHFVRTPDYLTEPDKYVKFLRKTMAGLAEIQSSILQGHQDMDFTRQQSEKVLLHTPLQNLEGKIILMTNVDTSIFRNLGKLGFEAAPSNEDLDYFVSLRIYLENDNRPVGATMGSSDKIPYGLILPYKTLMGMNDSKKATLAEKGKTRFVIAMPDPMDRPSQADITDLMTTTGVNIIPTNMFGQTLQDVKPALTAWNSTPFYNITPALLQTTAVAMTAYAGQMPSPA